MKSKKIEEMLRGATNYLHFWERKEIENYLINLDVIKRVAEMKLRRRNRADLLNIYDEKIETYFDQICKDCIEDIVGLSQESIINHKKNKKPISEENKECSTNIRTKINSFEELIKLVPGKVILSNLNTNMQKELGVSFTANELIKFMKNELIKFMKNEEIPEEVVSVLNEIEKFRLN